MTKRMLVDAAYPEETRVVVADNDQLLDFDFESASKRQLKGNIYLAKVTRVEPSLQAAFVEYGGNRHGFLAFSEIHPDYYQIPQADREKLAALEAQLGAAAADEDDEAAEPTTDGDGETGSADELNPDSEAEQSDMLGRLRRERAKLLRSYKIQEVIKRRQIMLVQVVKEERGTKGAALTTYLSLAGRYCVLMPNTPRGGGISRKIATASDRTRLKQIISGLEVPEGMGLIIRTAGQERTKAEIRRDYDYLLRLWSDIRDRTLQSIAPCAIYEEADLIRRAMRDLYQSDIEEILVEGEVGYRTAKAFMTMLMPSRARKVKQYKADTPIFFAHRIEDQLDLMHDSTVRLKSGGSIVINVTEALTAIDVNSGKSTRERHIDDTALKTNLEAADEIARQLRLRDIAGLVVIDFIDMAEHRHERQVEKRFREALKADRARLQVGRISAFGLLELSRQRLRPSFLELSSQPCPVCNGTGFIRSTESAALQALRRVEALGVEGKASRVAVTLPVEVALYLLNQKRREVHRIEDRYALDVLVRVDADMIASQFTVEVLEEASRPLPAPVAATVEPEPVVEEADEPEEETADERAVGGDEGSKRKRRRRRRRKPRCPRSAASRCRIRTTATRRSSRW
ncbi:MAG: Rne/Rng family ribonuclease [Pseudomonadota bacterium]